jgi:hypothetical protein
VAGEGSQLQSPVCGEDRTSKDRAGVRSRDDAEAEIPEVLFGWSWDGIQAPIVGSSLGGAEALDAAWGVEGKVRFWGFVFNW